MDALTTLRAGAIGGIFCLLPLVSASAETVLKYSSFNPLTHLVNKDVILPWAEEVAKVTEGRVRIEPLPKVVGGAAAQYDVAVDGLADITYVVPGYTPGRFDALSLGELPLLTDDPEIGSVAVNRFYEKHIKSINIFKGVKVLSVFGASAGQLFSKTPIRGVADMKGLKIRAPLTTTVPMMEAVGAVPIQKPVSEAYEMLSTGAMDASLSGVEQAIAYNLADVTNFLLLVPGGHYNSIQLMAVNQKTWDSISPADQAAIEKISGEDFARKMGKAFRGAIEAGKARMVERGHKVEIASPEFVADLKKAWGPVEAAALERAKANGLADPAAAMADYRAIIADVEKSMK